ncbi:MAG: DUF951 domain-containing protein [Bacillota bacterium]|nr:DUF951 domain-containing protein [Bacillota bacterium]MDW7684276.1 DUF951 domain-containing protein [Bacillota bacterium]
MADYAIGQRVRTKKAHPCGNDIWTIIRVGMDFRIKCTECGRSVMIPRTKFEKSVRAVLAENSE